MGEQPMLRSEKDQAERNVLEKQITEAVSRIHEPIDVGASLRDIEDQIVRATDDQERDRLNIERSALLRYQKALDVPSWSTGSVDEPRDMPEVSPDKEAKSPRFDDQKPVRRLGRLAPAQMKPSSRVESTFVLPKPQSTNETGLFDDEVAAK